MSRKEYILPFDGGILLGVSSPIDLQEVWTAGIYIVWQRFCEPARLRIAYCLSVRLSVRDSVCCPSPHVYRHVISWWLWTKSCLWGCKVIYQSSVHPFAREAVRWGPFIIFRSERKNQLFTFQWHGIWRHLHFDMFHFCSLNFSSPLSNLSVVHFVYSTPCLFIYQNTAIYC